MGAPGALCAVAEAAQENLGGLSESRVVHSVFLPCEDGLKLSGGPEEEHLSDPQQDGVALWKGAGQGQLCRELWLPFSAAHEPLSHGQQAQVWCWMPSAPCLLPLLQLWESFLGRWEEMGSLEAARAN